jgi:ATP-dependent DNA helicase RecG
MARSRKFRSTRRLPDSERSFFEQKLSGRYTRTLDRTDLLNLIRGGEDTYVEFKIRLVNIEKVASEIVALANSGGGALLFGVNDQRRVEGVDDPEQVEEDLIDICRNMIKPALLPRIDKVSFDNGTRIVVLQVDDRRGPHTTPDHRYFIRIGSTKREAAGDEIAALFSGSRVAAFEELPVTASAITDMDEALIWSYIRDLEGDAFREPEGFPTGAAVRDLKLAVDVGLKITPTLAGLLLFGRSGAVESLVQASRITLTRYSGGTPESPVVEEASYAGNAASVFERSLGFVKRYADLWDARPPRTKGDSDPIRARSRYSRDAIIEALVNLIVHRDYSIVAASSRVQVFDDRVELINPSRNHDLTRKSVEYGATNRQNPRLHRTFTSREYGIEPALHGIPSLRRAQYAFARREPKITLLGEEFRIELYGV